MNKRNNSTKRIKIETNNDKFIVIVAAYQNWFIWIEENLQVEKGYERHTQYLIKDKDEMLLIGRVGMEKVWGC